MRFLLPLLLLAGCATQPVAKPKPAPTPSRIEVSKPRWQAVPAKADGTPVPGGRKHVVKRGETGIAIAKAYGIPWSRIAASNRLGRDTVLEIGQPLFIPIAPPARPLTPEQQAAAFSLDVDDLITGSTAATPRPEASKKLPATPTASPPQPAIFAAVPNLGWPVDGRVILSRFGPKPGGRVNDGVNIKALRGQAVRSAADGEVIYVGDAIAGFGLMILVRHPGATVTAYGHLEDADRKSVV